jgi:hypothetical protein
MAAFRSMRIGYLFFLIGAVPIFSCTHLYDAELTCDIANGTPAAFDPWAAEMDVFEFDIVQRTCALEVVMRPVALRVPDMFVRSMDDTMEPGDADPDGTILACT